jgi:Ca2+-binding RTX toxin-like protein
MVSTRRRIALLAAPAALLMGLALPAAASAAVTCDFNAGTGVLTVTVTNGTAFPTISHDTGPGNEIKVDNNSNFGDGTVVCTSGTPTDTTTGSIVVNETGSGQGTFLTLDFQRGRLAPGSGAETGTAEIELSYTADATGPDVLTVDGDVEMANQSFQFGALGGGIGGDLNNDDDADDVQLTGVDRLDAQLGSGDDTLTGDGTGDAGFTGAVAVSLRDNIGSQGDDTYRSGTGGDNRYEGGADDDTAIGGSGADQLHMGAGDDTFDGAGGSADFISYSQFSGPVTLDMSNPAPQNTGAAGTDTVANAENIVGSNGSDMITGTNLPNTIFGGNDPGDTGDDTLNGLDGADSLFGRPGNDLLIGHQGDDDLYGELGTDTANFATGSTGPVSFDLGFGQTGMAQATGGAGSDTLEDAAVPSDPDSNHEVENLIGSPFAGDNLLGNIVANRINVLDGLLDTVDCVATADGDEAILDELTVDTHSNCEIQDYAPQTTIDSGPPDGATVNTATPTYMLSADELASFQVSVDSGPFQPCPASCAVGPLSDGAHALAFRAVDQDENLSPDQTPATRSVTIDTAVPPTVPPVPPAPAPVAQTPLSPVATENPECATLRAKLKRAKSKSKKRKIRKRLRALGC